MMSNLDYRDLSTEVAARLESCFSVLDNLEYLCKDCNPNGSYNFNLHDDLIMLVTESLADAIRKLRSAEGGQSES